MVVPEGGEEGSLLLSYVRTAGSFCICCYPFQLVLICPCYFKEDGVSCCKGTGIKLEELLQTFLNHRPLLKQLSKSNGHKTKKNGCKHSVIMRF